MSSILNQFRYSYEAAVVDVWVKATIGASGAATIVSNSGKGVVTLTAGNVGLYILTFKDKYQRILSADVTFIASGAPAAPEMKILTDSVSDSTSPHCHLSFYGPDGSTATDPASGETMLLHIVLKNSTV